MSTTSRRLSRLERQVDELWEMIERLTAIAEETKALVDRKSEVVVQMNRSLEEKLHSPAPDPPYFQ